MSKDSPDGEVCRGHLKQKKEIVMSRPGCKSITWRGCSSFRCTWKIGHANMLQREMREESSRGELISSETEMTLQGACKSHWI